MTAPDSRPRTWIGTWRPPVRLREFAWKLVAAPDAGRRWSFAALAVGSIPILVGFATGSWLHQPVTGLALAALVLPCVAADRFFRAAGTIAIVIFSHSTVAIGLSATDPERASRILRGSSDYWQKTWDWVRHNRDEEYRAEVWLPRHVGLVAVAVVLGYTSFGAVPIVRGIEEIDLMNFYVGQLLRKSDRPELALLFGWHPWSFVRGLAFMFIVFEVVSLSLERFTGRSLSTRRRRSARWIAGLSLAILDGVVKVTFTPAVREQLFRNLSPDSLTGFVP